MRIDALLRSLRQSRIYKVLRGYRPLDDPLVITYQEERKTSIQARREIRRGGNLIEDVRFPEDNRR